ncbi:hypothetical protein AKJ16_DCAP19537 [Drosera capensis]
MNPYPFLRFSSVCRTQIIAQVVGLIFLRFLCFEYFDNGEEVFLESGTHVTESGLPFSINSGRIDAYSSSYSIDEHVLSSQNHRIISDRLEFEGWRYADSAKPLSWQLIFLKPTVYITKA